MLTKEFLATFFAFLGEHHGFRLAHRIANHPFFVETIHRIPVLTFPCSSTVMEREKEKCEHHFIDFIFVVFHCAMVPFRSGNFNPASIVLCHESTEPDHW